jgi:integrase
MKSETKVGIQETEHGKFRLYWTHEKRYFLNTGLTINDLNLKIVMGVKLQIEVDIATENFDATLGRYKAKCSGAEVGGGETVEGELTEERLLVGASAAGVKIGVRELFCRFTEHRSKLGIDAGTLGKYNSLLKHLLIFFGDCPCETSIQIAFEFRDWMLEKGLAPRTVKERLGLLKSCWVWAGLINNPWDGIRVSGGNKKRPQPFSLAEVSGIIQASIVFCPHYADFINFLLSTGCRTGELTGLQWKSVFLDHDLEFGILQIKQIWNRGEIKKVKTRRSERELMIGSRLALILQSMLDELQITEAETKVEEMRIGDQIKEVQKVCGAAGERLVFTTLNECPIVSGQFSTRIWRPLLDSIDISYRQPYNCRATYISHLLYSDLNPITIAEMCGNSPRTIYENYAGLLGQREIPDILSGN